MDNFNDWDVPYSMISFFESALANHDRVLSFERQRDIVFVVRRTSNLSTIQCVLVDEYTLGLAAVMEALREFPGANCIVTGASWNAYTGDAKRYGLANRIGIFTVTEFLGALRWKAFWQYARKDEDGNPVHRIR